MGAQTIVTSLRRLPSRGLPFILVVAIGVAGILTACGGENDADVIPEGGEQQQLPEAAPAEAITLQCSAECAARGQCGTTIDGSDVVLLNLEGPAVEPSEHDQVAPVNAPVTVQETRPVALVEEATGAQFQHDFHRVFVAQQNIEGWVAEWCLSGPVP